EKVFETFLQSLSASRATGLVGHPTMQIGASDQLHREVGHAFGTDGELVYGHDVWMFQLSRDLCFTDEPAGIKGFLRKLFVQALQRDMTQEVAVCGRMNATHAPASQFRKDAQ